MFSEQNIFYFRLCDPFQKHLFQSVKNSHLHITIYREIFIKVFNTAKNTVIVPNFLVWKFCVKGQFCIVSGDSPKTMRKLCLSTKCPHQEITVFYALQVALCFLLFSEDVHQITVTNITTNSVKDSDIGEFDPEHAIDGDFSGLYHAARFDPVSPLNQKFIIKIDLGQPYSLRYFKYKIDDKQGFFLRIGGTTVKNDASYVGTYESSSNEKITFFKQELVTGQYAFLYTSAPPVAEFRLYEIEFFGI